LQNLPKALILLLGGNFPLIVKIRKNHLKKVIIKLMPALIHLLARFAEELWYHTVLGLSIEIIAQIV
jgi:hypothetical protein